MLINTTTTSWVIPQHTVIGLLFYVIHLFPHSLDERRGGNNPIPRRAATKHCNTGSTDLTDLCTSEWAHDLNQSRLLIWLRWLTITGVEQVSPHWLISVITYNSVLAHKPLILLQNHVSGQITRVGLWTYCLKSSITTGRKYVTDLWPNVTIKSSQACSTSLGHLKLMTCSEFLLQS